jgi:hypothetical protein
MGLFSRNAEVSQARAEYREANAAQQEYARTSGNRDENDATYLQLNDRTNETLHALKDAKKR